jgi:citrate synthase
MAVTCGLPINGAMASAINALDDIHGGAGQQCMELMQDRRRAGDAEPTAAHVEKVLDATPPNGKIIPGFGHRWHGTDPRAVRLMALVRDAQAGHRQPAAIATIGTLIEEALGAARARRSR